MKCLVVLLDDGLTGAKCEEAMFRWIGQVKEAEGLLLWKEYRTMACVSYCHGHPDHQVRN